MLDRDKMRLWEYLNWGQEEKGTTEDEMAGWHHWLDGHEFEWTPEVGDGQGGLACCNSWGRKESDTTERLKWTELKGMFLLKKKKTVYTSQILKNIHKACVDVLHNLKIKMQIHLPSTEMRNNNSNAYIFQGPQNLSNEFSEFKSNQFFIGQGDLLKLLRSPK